VAEGMKDGVENRLCAALSTGPSRASRGRFSSIVPGGWKGHLNFSVNLRGLRCPLTAYILLSYLCSANFKMVSLPPGCPPAGGQKWCGLESVVSGSSGGIRGDVYRRRCYTE
jgi:hypothetical protein